MYLLPRGFFESDAAGSLETASRSFRCCASSTATSARQTESSRTPSRTNQLLPLSPKARRDWPVRSLHVAYFQYAAWTTISQML